MSEDLISQSQGSLTILHLPFLLIAWLPLQFDLEDFARNWQLQEGCSFLSVCQGLVLTHISGTLFARFGAALERALLLQPECALSVCGISNLYLLSKAPSHWQIADFDQKINLNSFSRHVAYIYVAFSLLSKLYKKLKM